jgi:hypothetical protein
LPGPEGITAGGVSLCRSATIAKILIFEELAVWMSGSFPRVYRNGLDLMNISARIVVAAAAALVL